MTGSRSLLASIIAMHVACGSDSHPDSGYGANQPVPAAITCGELCERAADCFVNLCNENTSSTNYNDLRYDISSSCKLDCTDSVLQNKTTQPQWACMFTDTCREVFEHDSCMADASYTCE